MGCADALRAKRAGHDRKRRGMGRRSFLLTRIDPKGQLVRQV